MYKRQEFFHCKFLLHNCLLSGLFLRIIYKGRFCNHRKDKTTADPQPTLDDVKEKFEQALEQGSQEAVSYTHLENGAPLSGVEFALVTETGTRLMTAVSDANGLVTFEKIPYGRYTVEDVYKRQAQNG